MRLAALLLVFATSASAEVTGSFICKSDAAVGFKFENGVWTEESLLAERSYLIRPWREGDTFYEVPDQPINYVVVEVGREAPMAFFKLYGEEAAIYTKSVIGFVDFNINFKTMKFMMESINSFMLEGNETKYPPFFEIGRCSKL